MFEAVLMLDIKVNSKQFHDYFGVIVLLIIEYEMFVLAKRK